MPTRNTNSKPSPMLTSQQIMTTLFITLVIAIIWQGGVDDIARAYLNDAITNAAIMYGTSRGINAVVSLLQSIDLSAIAVSIQIGDILTPVHDAVERFSDVMVISIISLTLQRILLEIVEHNIFNILLTLSGLALCYAVTCKKTLISFALKIFLSLFFLRLSLALVLMLNMAVANTFIDAQTKQHQAGTIAMQDKLNNISESLQSIDHQAIQTDAIQDSVAQAANSSIQHDELTQHTMTNTDDASFLDSLVNGVQSLTQDAIEATASLTHKVAKKIQSYNVISDVKTKLQTIKEESSAWIQNMLTLMALLILKTMIIPLLFWYLLFKATKAIWVKDWSGIVHFYANNDKHPRLLKKEFT